MAYTERSFDSRTTLGQNHSSLIQTENRWLKTNRTVIPGSLQTAALRL